MLNRSFLPSLWRCCQSEAGEGWGPAPQSPQWVYSQQFKDLSRTLRCSLIPESGKDVLKGSCWAAGFNASFTFLARKWLDGQLSSGLESGLGRKPQAVPLPVYEHSWGISAEIGGFPLGTGQLCWGPRQLLAWSPVSPFGSRPRPSPLPS